jgi:uncharacterized caspase-like protein
MRWLWTLALGLTLWPLSFADALAEKRVALVIGNGAYVQVPHLPNPPHDAEDVAAALKRIGFETVTATDLSQAAMQEAEIAFARAARSADVALFYYSGHAMQFAGVNYLVPVDAQLRDEPDLRRMAKADQILADLQQAKTLRILVLDSCRDNPIAEALKRSIGLARGISIAQGLAKMESADGTIITYSTQAGRTAADGIGRNSPFTSAFLSHIEDKEDVATVFHRIGAGVYQATQGTQVPELSISFFGEFYLNGKPQLAAIQTPPPARATVDPCAAANEQWKHAVALGGTAALQDHVARFPNCPPLVGLARSKAVALGAPFAALPGADVRRFDGTWLGTRSCPPSGDQALQDRLQFVGLVKDGILHGQYGEVGKPDSQTFDGRINPDGSALISVKVLKGGPLASVDRSQPDNSSGYVATANFLDTGATGMNIATDRICRFNFTKLAEVRAGLPY